MNCKNSNAKAGLYKEHCRMLFLVQYLLRVSIHAQKSSKKPIRHDFYLVQLDSLKKYYAY